MHRSRIHALSGIGLLALAALGGYQLRLVFTFVDEGTNLMSGWLMSKGLHLYSDVWVHQFPLEYYISEAVSLVFGRSVGAARTGVLALNLSVFGLTMWATRQYAAVGIAALAWSLIGPFYFGHMLIYYALSGPLLAAEFLLALTAMVDRTPPLRRAYVVFGFCAGVALLANPATIFASGVAAAAWMLRRRDVRNGLLAGAIAGGIGAAGVFAMWVDGTLAGFFELAIRFNLEVYSQYPLGRPLSPEVLVRAAAAGLSAPEIAWMNLRNFASLAWSGLTLTPLDELMFGGLGFRLIAVLGSAALAARRQWLAAAFVYLFALATLVRAQDFFRASPFIVPCLAFGGWLLFEHGVQSRLATLLTALARLATIVTLAWMVARGGAYAFGEPERLGFTSHFGPQVARAEQLRRLVCEQADARMLVYPFDPLAYYLTGIAPSSRLHALYQWNANELPDTIARLAVGKHLVIVDWNASIWGYRVRDYAAPLAEFLAAQYVARSDSVYLSPELARACP